MRYAIVNVKTLKSLYAEVSYKARKQESYHEKKARKKKNQNIKNSVRARYLNQSASIFLGGRPTDEFFFVFFLFDSDDGYVRRVCDVGNVRQIHLHETTEKITITVSCLYRLFPHLLPPSPPTPPFKLLPFRIYLYWIRYNNDSKYS